MVRYPDTITIISEPDLVQDDTTGNFYSEGDPVVFSSECNAIPGEYNPLIKGPDGNVLMYEWIVSMPLTALKFKFGDKILLVKSDGNYEGTVKRQNNGRNNTLLWV